MNVIQRCSKRSLSFNRDLENACTFQEMHQSLIPVRQDSVLQSCLLLWLASSLNLML